MRERHRLPRIADSLREPPPKRAPNHAGRLLMFVPLALVMFSLFWVGVFHVAARFDAPAKIAAALGGVR